MDLKQLVAQLEDASDVNGMVGGLLTEVLQAENVCRLSFIGKHKGYSVVMDSFHAFFIETLKRGRQWVQTHELPEGSWYHFAYLQYLILFRSLRACEILLIHGYPFDAYGLLRDIKDRGILLCGVCHNITDFCKIHGSDTSQAQATMSSKDGANRRKDAERRVKNSIVGSKSGLSQTIQQDLREWEEYFHTEVHGSKLSLGKEIVTLYKQNRWPPLGPEYHERWLFYMNRVSEVCWLILRLLPYLQPSSEGFGSGWRSKYDLLDETFRRSQEKCAEEQNLAGAIIELVDRKFSFPQPFFFFEPTSQEQRCEKD